MADTQPEHCTTEKRPRKRANLLLLLLIPLVVTLVGFQIKYSLGPFWIGTNYDPDSIYLLAALNLAEFTAPGFVVHPGIPLEAMSALVLTITHLVAGQGTLVMDVLTRPQLFINALSYSLMALNALLLVFAGAIALRRTGSMTIALLVQLSPLLSCQCFARFPRIMAETLLLGVSALIGAVVIAYVYRADLEDEGYYPEIFGLLIGIAIASKINALPLALLPLLLMRHARIMLRYAVTTGLVFFVFVIPLILGGEWGHFWGWLIALISHTGHYGAGAQGIIDLSMYVQAIRDLLLNEPSLIAVLFLSMGTLLWSRGRRGELSSQTRLNLLRRSLFATICVQVLQVILVAKHPANRYLVPALGLMGLNLALMISIVREFDGRFTKSIASLMGIAVSVSILTFQVPQFIWLSRALEGHVTAELHTVKEIKRRNPGSLVESFGCSSVRYALFHGDADSGSRYRDRLAKMYPDFKRYHYGEGVLESSGKKISLKDLLALDVESLFVGYGLGKESCPASRYLELVYQPPQSKPVYYEAAKLYRLKKDSAQSP